MCAETPLQPLVLTSRVMRQQREAGVGLFPRVPVAKDLGSTEEACHLGVGRSMAVDLVARNTLRTKLQPGW